MTDVVIIILVLMIACLLIMLACIGVIAESYKRYIEKKNMNPTDEELDECVKEVIKHSVRK